MAADETPNFAEARARLDEILEELERETGDVDQLAARIKEAAGLIRFCRERLGAAQAEVREVVAELAATQDTHEEDAADTVSEPELEPEEDILTDEPEDETSAGSLPF